MNFFARITIACAILASIILGVNFVHAQSQNRAGLVIFFEDGDYETRCVSFNENSISGYELLQRSGFSIIASFEAQGAAICKIETVGCPASDCFCQSPPDYWSYWQHQGNDWIYAAQGSSNTQIQDGDMDAWAWGPGDPPALIDFDQICAAAEVNPTPTATKTSTTQAGNNPAASPTATSLPSTSTPTATPQAYPPPRSSTNSNQLSNQAYPPPSAAQAVILPTSATGAPAIQTATPMNPHLLFAAKLATPTPRTSIPTAQTTPAGLISQNLSSSTIPAQSDKSSISPGNYLVFGVLTLALLSLAIVLNSKKEK